MDDRQPRVFIGLCALVLVWIGAYWMWEPGEPESPRISVAAEEDPAPDLAPVPADRPDREPEPWRSPVASPSPPVSRPTRGVVAPEFRIHTVRAGEVFQDIAETYYGKRGAWSVIARANPLVDPRRLREGMEIRVPLDPGNIQGLELADDGEEPPQRDDESLAIEYIVQPGDSLSVIAHRHYGSQRYADLIFNANRDQLRSINDIRVGQTLKLPPLGDD